MLSLEEENLLYRQGYTAVAGIDEVGRGPLAGPVVAAAVILPSTIKYASWMEKVDDSKKLTSRQREDLFNYICDAAVSHGIGIVNSMTIDFLGIAKATCLAMKQAVEQLVLSPEYLLIDYVKLPEVKIPQKGIVDGDARCFSIACASIIAKVCRDRIMDEMDRLYPGYNFAGHKGYGTREHLDNLRKLGPCPIHRRSFQPVKELLNDS